MNQNLFMAPREACEQFTAPLTRHERLTATMRVGAPGSVWNLPALLKAIARESETSAEELCERLRSAIGDPDFDFVMTTVDDMITDDDGRNHLRRWFWDSFLVKKER